MNSESINSKQSLSSLLKSLPAFAIGITTTCFVLGLLIVNLRQAQYGIYSLDFVRTEYMLVGAVFLFLVTCSQLIFIRISSDSRPLKTAWKERKFGHITIEIFSILMVGTALFQFIFISCFHTTFPFNEGWAWISVFTLTMFGYVVKGAYEEALNLLPSNSGNSEPSAKPTGNPNTVVILITSLLGFLATYSNFTYPHISPALGGGDKSSIVLIPTPRGLEIGKALSLPIQNNQTIGPINILTETEKEIVILVPDDLTEKMHAIRLNRDLFEAIQATHKK